MAEFAWFNTNVEQWFDEDTGQWFPKAFASFATDSFDIGDSVSAVVSAINSISDGVNFGDNTENILEMLQSITDGFALGDSAEIGNIFSNNIIDGLSFNDETISGNLIIVEAVLDGLKLSDVSSEGLITTKILYIFIIKDKVFRFETKVRNYNFETKEAMHGR